ncbi:hypothetical protein N0V90_012661 [Kalmusia sp. IMI 367209]|nr:hypothetical protein N0V90_012661 [Kalmusia sp. IMI 367209]
MGGSDVSGGAQYGKTATPGGSDQRASQDLGATVEDQTVVTNVETDEDAAAKAPENPTACLQALTAELLARVAHHLPQKALLNLAIVNRNISTIIFPFVHEIPGSQGVCASDHKWPNTG